MLTATRKRTEKPSMLHLERYRHSHIPLPCCATLITKIRELAMVNALFIFFLAFRPRLEQLASISHSLRSQTPTGSQPPIRGHSMLSCH